jgi:hypothetical protein
MEPKNEFTLDLYHLDKAYLDYPSLIDKTNTLAVESEIKAMDAKNAMDDRRTFLDQDIRENPGTYGLTGIKLTEGIVTAQVNSDQELKNLTDEHYRLLTDYKRGKSTCASVASIGKTLEGLTTLFKAGYFASNPICSMPETYTEKETTAVTPQTKAKLNSRKK